MSPAIKIEVNLATRPLRNHRFIRAAAAALGLGGILLGWLTFGTLAGYKGRQKSARAEIARLERTIQVSERERVVRDRELADIKRVNKDKVDLVNQALMKKGFSWVEFFTLLEDALPPASYISSMAPVSAVDGRFEVRFKVVSVSLADTLKLVQNLSAVFRTVPFVQNEVRMGGQHISEIILTYERTR